MKRLVIFLVIITFSAVPCFAQGRRGGFGGGFGGRGRGVPVQMDEQEALLVISALLNLNQMQQQQLHTIFDAADQAAAPMVVQIEGNKEAVFEAVKAGKADDQVRMLAAQAGSLASQMASLQAQTFAKMWALLNSDQKPQVDVAIYNDITQFLSTAKTPLAGVPPASPDPANPPN